MAQMLRWTVDLWLMGLGLPRVYTLPPPISLFPQLHSRVLRVSVTQLHH